MSVRLNVIDREGKETALDIEEGTTIRDAIEEKLSPDNYGVCGGSCACGTCHVYFTPGEFEKLKENIETGKAPFDQQQALTLEFYEKRISALETRLELVRDAIASLKANGGNNQ